jgi:hypothetical protein
VVWVVFDRGTQWHPRSYSRGILSARGATTSPRADFSSKAKWCKKVVSMVSSVAQSAPYIICHPGQKRPKGENWADRGKTAEQVARYLVKNPRLNVGILLGPATGIIDVECDSSEATDNLRELVGDDLLSRTPAWSSTRGNHYLFRYDERLASKPNKVVFRAIEFRLGNGKATQSICPPSIVDEVKREWIRSLDDCEPQLLPEAVVEALIAHSPEATPKYDSNADPCFKSLYSDLNQAMATRLATYFARHKLPCSTRTDHTGRTFFDFSRCIFTPERSKGASAIILNPDGSVGAKCFHPECEGKGLAAVEEIYGTLSPRIRLSTDLERNVNEAIAALANDTRVYQRSGVLVQVITDVESPPLCLHDNGGPRLRQIPLPVLTTYLSSAARWEKHNARKRTYVRCTPPPHIVAPVDAAIDLPGIRPITGIVSAPVLRENGTVATAAGYDPQTGLYLDTDGEYPSLMLPKDALAWFDDILYDFPFASSIYRAAAIAAIVTLHARAAFAGSSPMFLVDANASRIGKGLFTDLATTIYEGRPAARFSPPTSDEECRKVITSAAMSGAPYIVFDNVKDEFGGQSLENAITTGRWCDRVLGGNKQIDVPINWAWFATSNNATLTNDMLGRTCHVRLETNAERPELRSGWRHHDLLAYVKANRSKLSIAALSIPAAYIAAGRPDMRLPAWGGFQGWSDLVRSSLVWAGLADPGETREALREHADGDDTDVLRLLLDAWDELSCPATVATALQIVDTDVAGNYPRVAAAIAELGVSRDKRNEALGKLLRKYRGRVLSGRKFQKVGDKKWRVARAA